MPDQKIEMASREWKRLINSAVGRSFLKTVTEPLTNSDSASKERSGVNHASGLVEQMMKLRKDDRLESSKLKAVIAAAKKRAMRVELYTTKSDSSSGRECRVVDRGIGMTAAELQKKFGTYAAAKAKGKQTRSLFGRGALDVLLYHENSTIFSVKDSRLASCEIFWDKNRDPRCRVEDCGPADAKLLNKFTLPADIVNGGTVVKFSLREGTHVPQEAELVQRLGSFYMLRLIASDPNSEVTIHRVRSKGTYTDTLSFDFPVGVVLAQASDALASDRGKKYPVDILVCRSDEPLRSDHTNIETRENGLLFVDDNDAVLDLTLLPEDNANPFLNHIFGIVRITGIRELLESLLEADEPVAVLTQTRDGFDQKSDVAAALFRLVSKHVKPIYKQEEQRQRKGGGARSEEVAKRVKDALKALNAFNSEETEDDGHGDDDDTPKTDEAIAFSSNNLRLLTGRVRRVTAFVNLDKVAKGEAVLFETDNPEIKVEPEEDEVKGGANRKYHRIAVTVLCNKKGEKGTVSAITLVSGKEHQAKLTILGVEDPPPVHIPDDIEFTQVTFSGEPAKSNRAALLVNLGAFNGMPEVSFVLNERTGSVTIGETKQTEVKYTVSEGDILPANPTLARIAIPFFGTGWGQKAKLTAKATKAMGEEAVTSCKLRIERTGEKFADFVYEPLDSKRLADVAGDKIYVNAKYEVHQEIFGATQDDFDSKLESDPVAQMRAAQVVVEAAVYDAAYSKWLAGGKKGLMIEEDDPITSVRSYAEESRMKLEPKVMKALVIREE